MNKAYLFLRNFNRRLLRFVLIIVGFRATVVAIAVVVVVAAAAVVVVVIIGVVIVVDVKGATHYIS